eukprot:351098-Pyramimonas_sp.AAC.1
MSAARCLGYVCAGNAGFLGSRREEVQILKDQARDALDGVGLAARERAPAQVDAGNSGGGNRRARWLGGRSPEETVEDRPPAHLAAGPRVRVWAPAEVDRGPPR